MVDPTRDIRFRNLIKSAYIGGGFERERLDFLRKRYLTTDTFHANVLEEMIADMDAHGVTNYDHLPAFGGRYDH